MAMASTASGTVVSALRAVEQRSSRGQERGALLLLGFAVNSSRQRMEVLKLQKGGGGSVRHYPIVYHSLSDEVSICNKRVL